MIGATANTALAEAHRAFSLGDLDAAEARLEALLRAHPKWPPAVHLAGLVARDRGDLSRAEDLMRESLELPGVSGRTQAEFANNLGNLLFGAGYTPSAEVMFQYSLSAFELPQARLGLARAALGLLRPDDALAHLDRLPVAAATAPAAVLLRAEALSQTGERKAALEVLTAAGPEVRARSDYWLALGARLGDLGLFDDALTALRPLLRGPEAGRARLAMVDLCVARRDWEGAQAVLREGLAAEPRNVEMLSRSAALAWMSGDPVRFADGLRAALATAPDDRPLRLALVTTLQNAARHDEAEGVLREGLARLPDDEHALALLALRCAETGRQGEADEAIAAALRRAPELELVRENAAIVSLTGLRVPDALAHTEWLIERRPRGQTGWALRTLALRVAGDQSWRSLAEPERVCRVATLSPPQGFATIAEYNAELALRLRQRHTLEAHPLVNSVRGGTQVEIHMGSETDPVVRAFFDVIHPAIEAFMTTMPKAPGHPLFGREPKGYRISGCWTVRLFGGGGSHVGHIHPRGWLSSAYYLAVPPEVPADPVRGGWLHFGRPPYPIPGIGPTGWVQPSEGRLALFPSYQWHGVEPFPGQGERMTVAFDVVPTSG